LDFESLVITGPSTDSTSIGKYTNGVVSAQGIVAGVAYNIATTCRTDTFTVGGSNVPVLCGTLSGDHIYFEADDECHDLSFALGQTGVGTTKQTDRKFSIKVTQIPCDADYRAPTGCLQYHTGTATSEGTVTSFNYGQGIHLANQAQVICFRREQGNCRICFTADKLDFDVSGEGDAVVNKLTSCCAYGEKGAGVLGYDCVMIPGAEKKTIANPQGNLGLTCQGGGGEGLGIVPDAKAAVTVCSSVQPFQISFYSDAYEVAVESIATARDKGFSIKYFQTTC
jgi:hypothetical protein